MLEASTPRSAHASTKWIQLAADSRPKKKRKWSTISTQFLIQNLTKQMRQRFFCLASLFNSSRSQTRFFNALIIWSFESVSLNAMCASFSLFTTPVKIDNNRNISWTSTTLHVLVIRNYYLLRGRNDRLRPIGCRSRWTESDRTWPCRLRPQRHLQSLHRRQFCRFACPHLFSE